MCLLLEALQIAFSHRFSFLSLCFRYFELEKVIFPYDNSTMIDATWLRKDKGYQIYYMFWSKVIFLEVIPYCTIFILNALIIRQIVSSFRFRQAFQSTQNGPPDQGHRHSQQRGNGNEARLAKQVTNDCDESYPMMLLEDETKRLAAESDQR